MLPAGGVFPFEGCAAFCAHAAAAVAVVLMSAAAQMFEGCWGGVGHVVLPAVVNAFPVGHAADDWSVVAWDAVSAGGVAVVCEGPVAALLEVGAECADLFGEDVAGEGDAMWFTYGFALPAPVEVFGLADAGGLGEVWEECVGDGHAPIAIHSFIEGRSAGWGMP